ncbi:MAG TPA: sugar phosphate isomerase/epimerase family protein [Chthoniobacteraceae bacterium]|jgi:sugar phosphate isomerase/epimerase|nr:sugar phosphate isomerase/epimerase family protein [Chthoniobacteraceae bacterium]
MLSVSTCWNSGRHTEGEEMLQELLDLGFDRVELGHGIRLSLMEGVQRMFDAGRITISSLHNFCPLPVEITRASPDCYQFSSPDDRERERAMKFSLQTIDFAARLNAKFVVLHLGRSPIGDFTDRLIRMAEVGLGQSRAYVQAKLDCVKQREAKVGPYFKRARECLRRIANYAAEKDVRLGVESRHSFEEIPCETEMLEVLEEFNVPHVGYWHDFGHVQVKHNLGFLDHVEWMQEVAPRLIGCHLHDTQWPGRDHMAPFQGDVEYSKLIPLLPKDTLFVFEMSPRRTREEIIEGRERWIKKFGA